MIKPIVKDIFFLRRKAETATREDIQVGIDLQDTLRANREACMGMAANMIGVNKRVIIVNMGFVDVVMFNPVLIKKIPHMRQRKAACHLREYVKLRAMRI